MKKYRHQRFFSLLLVAMMLAAGTGCTRDVQQTPESEVPQKEQKLDETMTAEDEQEQDSLSAKLPTSWREPPPSPTEPE